MNLEECYQALGGNYQEVISMLRKESLIEKFLLKFLNDPSYQLFESSMNSQNYEEALRGVHTLKGICLNLSFTQLSKSSSALTQALRNGDLSKVNELRPILSKDYEATISAIQLFQNEKRNHD